MRRCTTRLEESQRAVSGIDVITRLEGVIAERVRERPEGSYVTTLLEGGEPALAAKLREEATELIEAGDAAATAHEAADLLFHLLVTLGVRGVSVSQVCRVLEGRFGIGGHQEKASRTRGGS